MSLATDIKTITNDLTFASVPGGEGLNKALALSRVDIIESVREAKLKGRGGAGFPTGVKWNLAAAEQRRPKYVICNADEGEPGTFKDRLILSEFADLVFDGMTIGARAIGASLGLIYLRAEYGYLRSHLEEVRGPPAQGRPLGPNIGGIAGFNFDVLIAMGAGAYVCGEETALIESLEGFRGEPRNRPPFPVVSGFLDRPSVINNVETLAWVACIFARGVEWFNSVGTAASSGHKLFSISGDCEKPGVYEFPFGLTIGELLEVVGGSDAKAVQVGGASGRCVPRGEFERRLAFEDVPTGGSVIVLGPGRDMGDDRREPPGVLRRRVLRPVHPVPAGQRQAARRAQDAAAGYRLRGLSEGSEGPGGHHAGCGQVRPRSDESLGLRVHNGQLRGRGPRPEAGLVTTTVPTAHADYDHEGEARS